MEDRIIVLSAAILFAGTAIPVFAGSPHWMTDMDLHYVFVGREVTGAYANGVPFRETYRKSGKIEYSDTANTLAGNWEISGGKLCTKYAEQAGGCYKITKVSANCFEYWLLAADGANVEKSWIARSSQSKYPSSCPK
jgi:hypothetical protein